MASESEISVLKDPGRHFNAEVFEKNDLHPCLVPALQSDGHEENCQVMVHLTGFHV